MNSQGQSLKGRPSLSIHLSEVGRSTSLDASQIRRMREADRLEASARPADQRQAIAIRRQIAQEIAERISTSIVDAGFVESVKLEQARGGEVDTRSPVGRCHMKDRDGLRSLLDHGRITREEYMIGLAYRRMTEAAFSGGKSQLEPSVGGGAVDLVGNAYRRAKAGTLRTEIDIAVARLMRAEPAGLVSLRQVAGEGRSLRSMVSGSRAFDRHLEALRSALAIASDVMRC